MKWATVFQQVAARPEAVDEIARLNGLTPDEIRVQVERQTTCAGANYDLARRAKDALARQAERSDSAKRIEEEARKRMEEEAKKKVKEEIKDKLEEEARKAWDEEQERQKQQREQAQREQAQRAEQQRQQALREQAQREALRQQQAQRGSQISPQRSSQSTSQGSKKSGGCSKSLKRLLGAAVLIGALLAIWYVAKEAGPALDRGTGGQPGVTPTCPPQVSERRKCPWSPDGYTVEPCPPGFCYDAGPQGSLSCKQENAVENSHQNDLSTLVCNDGYYPERDPCTNVIVRCVKQ